MASARQRTTGSQTTARLRSRKRDQIVDTATVLFSRHGIRRVTVEEICREAGASKMTFYKYFSNKIELFKHIWNGWAEEGYARFEELRDLPIPFPRKIQMMLDHKMEFLSRISPELLSDLLRADSEFKELVQQLRAENLRRFLAFMAQAQQRGDMRPDMRPEFVMAVLDKLTEMADDAHLQEHYADPAELIREINYFFCYGILPAPGHDPG